MEWKSLLLGVTLGIFLLPVLLTLGLRLILWLATRKLKKMMKEMQERGDLTVHTFDLGAAMGGGPSPLSPLPALTAETSPLLVSSEGETPSETSPLLGSQKGDAPPSETSPLLEAFLQKTGLTGPEWEQVREQVVFVHDGLSSQELESLGFPELHPQGTPRQRARGQAKLLGTLEEPMPADVYMLASCPSATDND